MPQQDPEGAILDPGDLFAEPAQNVTPQGRFPLLVRDQTPAQLDENQLLPTDLHDVIRN